MKKLQHIKYWAALLAVLPWISCVRFEHEAIPDSSALFPQIENAHVVSVTELMGTFPGKFDSITQYVDQDSSLKDYYILVQVIGNDISGNIYKSMYVRDALDTTRMEGRALNLAIDKTGLYNFFPIGQRFLLKCSGLYIGQYEGLPQIGFRYKDDNGVWGLGRIPDEVFMRHAVKYGPAPSDSSQLPKPIEITEASQLNDPKLYNQLVLLRKVHFLPDEIGQEFAPAPPVGTNPTSTNRYFTIDGEGTELALRTSSACRFFRRLIPEGEGDMLCIYAIYGENKQFYLRQFSDLNLAQFEQNAGVNVPVFHASFASGSDGFTARNIEGDAAWEWGSYGNGCMMLQGSSEKEANEDWLVSPAIELTDTLSRLDLTFNQALSYKFEAPDSYYTVRISENYDESKPNPLTADWTVLEIPNAHPGNSFDFLSSGNIDLSAYRGKKVHIAFVYLSDTEYMATWEVNNVMIVGNK